VDVLHQLTTKIKPRAGHLDLNNGPTQRGIPLSRGRRKWRTGPTPCKRGKVKNAAKTGEEPIEKVGAARENQTDSTNAGIRDEICKGKRKKFSEEEEANGVKDGKD